MEAAKVVPKFKSGDKVVIVNYGHIFIKFVNGMFEVHDMMPELVGKQAIIDKIIITQNIPEYSLKQIKSKVSWYKEDQLQLTN